MVSADEFISRYDRIISDKMSILFLYGFLMISLFATVFFYISKDLYNTIKRYYDNRSYLEDSNKVNDPNNSSENSKDKQADNIYYPDYTDGETIQKVTQYSLTGPVNPNSYKDKGEIKFYKDIDDTYYNYNQQKTNYISRIYSGRDNDDIINDKIQYSKYDDYEYPKKKE
jgi:hypothetical protein